MVRRLHPPASQHNNLLASQSDTSRRRIACPLQETNVYTKSSYQSKHSNYPDSLLLGSSLCGACYIHIKQYVLGQSQKLDLVKTTRQETRSFSPSHVGHFKTSLSTRQPHHVTLMGLLDYLCVES